jgi:hypothetical protein
MFELDNPFWNKWLEFIRDFWGVYSPNWRLNLRLYVGKIGSISIGNVDFERGPYFYYYPAEGWIHTDGTNGVVEWEGTLYGDLEIRNMWWDDWLDVGSWACMGIVDFEGLWIQNRFRSHTPVYLLGNAQHVNITYEQPDIDRP